MQRQFVLRLLVALSLLVVVLIIAGCGGVRF